MPSVDERIVSMAFDNAKFEAAVAQTLGTLGKLDAAIKNLSNVSGMQNLEREAEKVTLNAPVSALGRLKSALGTVGSGASTGFSAISSAAEKVNLSGPITALEKVRGMFGRGVTKEAQDSFAEVEKAANKVELKGLTDAVSGAAKGFSVLQGAASVALGNIASQAAMRGAAFGKSFAFGPIKAGFDEYKTNLGSIQTILANTQDSGGNLKTVNEALGELNHYSDQTIYNFSEMAKNIGTFTAAGVDLDKSTQSIKGIANLAALSGSSSQQASTAMYQLSQAIASGKVGLQDWNSVVNAGMGGAVFQKALIQTGQNMGTIAKGAVEIDKETGKATVNGQTFRDSIMAKPGQKPWLTDKVLTETLSQFTGDMKEADLIAQGFDKTQADAIMKRAATAKAAATEVKTLSQAFDVARESIGSGWSKTFQLIFGDFEQSKKTFTEFSNFLNGFINKTSDARNKLLGDFNKLGGREKLIDSLKEAFNALKQAITPIHDAFRNIFPPATAKDLFNLVDGFGDLAEKVATFFVANRGDLTKTFEGLFAVLHIGWTITKRIIGVIGDLLGAASGGAGGFLEFTGSIGEFLVGLDKAISKGESLDQFFQGLTDALKVPLRALRTVAGLLKTLFTGADIPTVGGQAVSAFDMIVESLGPLGGALEFARDALNTFRDALKDVANFLQPVFDDAIQTVAGFADKITAALKQISFDDAMQALTTAGIGGIFLTLKKAIGGGVDVKFFDNVKESVVGTLDAVNGSLTAMQRNIQANTLLQIGIAVAALAAGILILSKIDPQDLTKAMTATAVGLGQLVGSIKLLGGAGGAASLAVMPLVATAMIGMATAMVILAGAVTLLSKLSWEEIAKGLVGVGGGLAAIGLGIQSMPKRVLLVGPALIPLAIGLGILAGAMKIFATMSWEDMAKGLAGVGFGLEVIARGIQTMGPSIKLVGPGLIAVGGALILISFAVASFGNMDLMTLGKGLGSIGASLAIIGKAMLLFPKTLALQAAGLVILGVALVEIGTALALIGNLKVSSLAKGLISIALALDVFAVGLTAMSATIPGSAALLLAAAGLAVLTPVLITMGNLDWGTILKGLAAMALTMGVISIVAVAAGPALIVFGAGLAALGLGLLGIGTAIYVAAKGISLLSESGQKGISVLLVAITGFIALIPKIVISFIQGLVSIVEEVAKVAPKVAFALGVIIDSLLTTIIEQAPKLAIAAGSLIDAFLVVIDENAYRIIQTGLGLLLNLLSGIADNIGQVTVHVAEIIIHFLDAIAKNAPRIVASGARTLTSYLQGVANNVGKVIASAANVVLKFLEGVTQQLPKVMAAGAKLILTYLENVAKYLPRFVKAGVDAVVNFLEGIANNLPRIVKAGAHIIEKLIRGIGDAALELVDVAAQTLIKFMNGLAKAIREYGPQIRQAGYNIADAIIDGLVAGFKELGHKAVEGIKDIITALPKKAISILDIASPSKVFHAIGGNIMQGLANGLADTAVAPQESLGNGLKLLLRQTGAGKEFGQFLGQDFKKGLMGTAEDISGAFKTLRTKLRDEQDKLADQVKQDQADLKSLREADDPDEKAIAKASAALNKHRGALDASRGATKLLMESLAGERKQLLTLAATYSEVGVRLDEAKKDLDRLTQARDSDFSSFSDQFGALPDFGEESKNQVEKYKETLRKQIDDTKKFMATLKNLRELGLDDATYRKLVQQGTKAQGFADALLASGKGGIDELNAMDAELASSATDIATQAASALYDAGIEAAKGLVAGLAAEQTNIQAQMDKIASSMIASIKQALGIKSPSTVMAAIGKFAAEGVISGLKQTSSAVRDAAANVGNDAAQAMSDSLSQIGKAVSAEIDIDPTITPVLDLTQVRKDASTLSDLTNVVPITAAASYGQASAISADQQAAQAAAAAEAPVTQFNFEQNNYSPEALSDIEIYRQTHNQLAQVKRVVGLPA